MSSDYCKDCNQGKLMSLPLMKQNRIKMVYVNIYLLATSGKRSYTCNQFFGLFYNITELNDFYFCTDMGGGGENNGKAELLMNFFSFIPLQTTLLIQTDWGSLGCPQMFPQILEENIIYIMHNVFCFEFQIYIVHINECRAY